VATDSGIRLGRILGAPVILQRSWFVVAALVTFLYLPYVQNRLPDLGAGAVAVAFAFAVLLLLSVFVHELAHTLTARATGQPVTEIVLDLWGGHTVFGAESAGPGRSALVAAAGPLSNALLAVLTRQAVPVVPAGGIAEILLDATALANIIVAVINALPGLPLDGGRLVEALVWWVRGDRLTGTLVAGWSGRVVTAGLVAWFVVLPTVAGDPPHLTTVLWLLLVAGMLWQGATRAIQVARWGRLVPRLAVSSLLRPAVVLADSATVAQAASTLAGTGPDGAVVVLDGTGRPVALVEPEAVAAVPSDLAATTPVTAVTEALPVDAVVGADLTGDDLLRHLRGHPFARYAVLDGQGRTVGVLAWADVEAALTAR